MVSDWLSICHTSVFLFPDDNLSKFNRFPPNLVCALILWRSGLGLLMGKFCQFSTESSARNMSVVSFLEDNFSKSLWISTRLGMCIDIVEICFGIANGQISSIFDRVICNTSVFYFQDNNLSKSQWIFTKFDMCIISWRSALGLLIGKFRLFLTVICP